jgi:uncharacterized damage-inducible protein DinB
MLRRGADRAGEDGVPDTDMFQTFARYNEWMNEKVYAVCAGIDDAERKRDRGAFFKSIHGTLNHLLFGDRAWMGRFTGRKYEIAPIGVDLYDDFSELRAARGAMDKDILEWTASLTEAWLGETLTWTSGVDGLTRTRPRRLLVSQLFNHQTHHRGQLTTLLCQMGYDVGPTDLPWMEGP